MRKEFISRLHDVIKKNNTLKNAVFYKEIDNSIFENKGRYSEGVFIALENGKYDWTQTHYLGEDGHYTKILSIDGILYTFFSFEKEGDNKWKKYEKEMYDLKEIIYPLLEETLLEEYIAAIRVEEKDSTHYFIDLSEAYIEDLKQEAIANLKEGASTLDKDEADFIEAVNDQIETFQNREYRDSKVEIVVNEEGYLIQFKERFTYKDAHTEPDEITICLDYQLKEYNLNDPMQLFPEVDEV